MKKILKSYKKQTKKVIKKNLKKEKENPIFKKRAKKTLLRRLTKEETHTGNQHVERHAAPQVMGRCK